MRIVELVSPARLGPGFRWLLSSALMTNIADGILLAAGPLLIASETRDPLLVASAVFLQQLPWLLFGVLAGAFVDRLDRRLVVVVTDSLRAVVLLALTGTVATGVVEVRTVLVSMFLLGTAETFSDLAGQTLLVGLVEKQHLGIANSRLIGGGNILANQLAGPPIGAFLFAVARPWPFVVSAVAFMLGAVLVSRIALRPRPPAAAQRSVRAEVVEGVVWLWRHPAMRTLALTIVLFNVTFGAGWAVLVLYSQERLGLGAAGFGWLTTAGALGGLTATTAYGWLERTVGVSNLMRVGLVLETLTHLALALTTTAWVAFVVLFFFGAHVFIWGTTAQTVRQRTVPDALQGRVGSVYMIGMIGGMLVGTPIGGLLARSWGLTAPFWFGFVGSAILVVVMWRRLAQIAPPTDNTPAPV